MTILISYQVHQTGPKHDLCATSFFNITFNNHLITTHNNVITMQHHCD